MPVEELLAIRLEVSDSGSSATVVAQRGDPGVGVKTTAPTRGAALGTAELMYERAREGYQDRFGGFRFPAFALVVFSPLVALSVAYDDGDAPIWLALVTFAVAVGLAFGVLPILLKRPGFELVEPGKPEPGPPFSKRLSVLAENKWARRAGWAVVTVVLGVIATKLAELI